MFENLPPAAEATGPAPVSAPEEPAAPEPPEPESTGPATIQDAIDRVNHIVETLRQALDDMEEVLEMLETIERQSTGDQQEIESLRRSLRQLQRPRHR